MNVQKMWKMPKVGIFLDELAKVAPSFNDLHGKEARDRGEF